MALCEELACHVTGNQALLENQQFELVFRLINAALQVGNNSCVFSVFYIPGTSLKIFIQLSPEIRGIIPYHMFNILFRMSQKSNQYLQVVFSER